MKSTPKISIRLTAALIALALTAGVLGYAIPVLASPYVTSVITQNSAPIAENQDYTTYRNIPITGIFSAIDPDGDLVTFNVMSDPKKGSVEVMEDGSFIYSPKENKKGKDSFTYTAIDVYGNISNEATVKIVIEKQDTKVTYSDMKGNAAHYSALRLAESGVFVGEKLGSEYFFSPERQLTRGEFLAMCLKTCDIEPLPGITQTGFYDDGDFPMWVKPYVATALMSGIINGYSNSEGRAVFSANTPITLAEAAVVLNNVLEITNVSSGSFEDEALPSWAYQAASNLEACNMLPSTGAGYTSALTRAQAAQMLAGAMDVLSNRDSGSKGGLLSWAK